MNPARFVTFFLFAAPLLVVPGCITSSPAEYGATPGAKKLNLPLCPNGLIDDGEDGDGQILKVDGRDGYWFTFGDTEGTTYEPRGAFHMSPGGRPKGEGAEAEASTQYARVYGKVAPKGKSLYVGAGFAFSNPKSPFDLSQAKGIQFWAKGPGKIRFKVPDVNTDPAGDRCNDCYNDFGVDIYLSDRWERYTVPFDELRQQPGWGDRAPYVASGGVMAVQWQFSTPGAEYDLGFDDVALVGCETDEAGTSPSSEASPGSSEARPSED